MGAVKHQFGRYVNTDTSFNYKNLTPKELVADVSGQRAHKLAFFGSDFDLPIKRRRIPIILMFDDSPIDDPHEAAALDPKRLSSRSHTKGIAQKCTGHDPFAGLRLLGDRAVSHFHFEIRKRYERPFKESLDGLSSAEQFVQSDIAIEGLFGEKTQKQ
jgi:hypothetical protein